MVVQTINLLIENCKALIMLRCDYGGHASKTSESISNVITVFARLKRTFNNRRHSLMAVKHIVVGIKAGMLKWMNGYGTNWPQKLDTDTVLYKNQ